MSYRYILDRKAQEDYEDALKWYLERSETAAANFVTAIDETLAVICNSPTRWRNTFKHFYEFSAKKYRYTIVYSIEEIQGLIFVSAIYHHKRSPRRKFRK